MLDTYIKNRGSSKTIIHDNNKNNISEINWDADYDGNVAKLSLDLNNNGKSGHYNIKLNNNDLAKMLNIDSVNLPIHKRLKKDFKKKQMQIEPSFYNIYLDDLQTSLNPKLMNYNPTVSLDSLEQNELMNLNNQIESLDSLLQLSSPNSHISSPLPNEELLIPLTLNGDSKQSYVLTPRKRHRRPRTHKTHRVYKHHRITNSSSKKSKSKSKTQRKKSKSSIKNSIKKYFSI